MVEMIVVVYLLGWLLTSAALLVASRLMRDRSRRAPRSVIVSAVAGGAWLLLLIGAAQFGALVAITRAFGREESGNAVIPTAMDEFV